jgi:hypothetical protein
MQGRQTMKKATKLFTVIFLLLAGIGLFAQDRGLSVVAADNLGSSAAVGRQYALFIAIDAYRTWPALKKPVADAREIRDILQKDYYIDEVIELHDQQATKTNIIKAFTDLQPKLGVHDSLFIYYAGHGHLDEGSGTGFWIPVDGGTDIYAQDNWLPNSQIRGYISRLKTIHVFMVSDSCFSGDILNTNRAMPPQIDNAYYRKAYGLTSRQVLTSGSSEKVPDQSEFSEAIKNCLLKNTAPLLDPFGIYNDVRLSIEKTTPLYGYLSAASHQEGATFLFFRRQVEQIAAPPVAPPQPQPQAVFAPQTAPPSLISAAVGNIAITSEIAGEILIDGTATGSRIKAGGSVTVTNVSAGNTEVAVKEDDGKITKTAQTVVVQQGQTVTAAIKAPASQPAAQTAPQVVQPPAAPVSPAPVSDGVISSTSGWRANNDNNSSANVSVDRERIDGRELDVLTININLAGGSPKWAGVNTNNMGFLQKLKNANGVRFKVLGDGKTWSVQFETRDVTDSAYHGAIISTQKGKVSSIDIPYRNLRQPDWGKKIIFNKNNITGFAIERHNNMGGTGASAIKVFDFEVY